MTDVLPIVFVGADEDLAVQLIGRHRKRGHVGRKLKESGQTFDVDETETSGKRSWWSVFVSRGKDESPLAEARDVDVIRIGLQTGLLECLRDAPEGVASKHWGGALHNHEALRAEVA